MRVGETIEDADAFSLPNLNRQISNLKWITLGAVGGSFLCPYATLVYMVWEGWRTIVRQRVQLESANAELESRVAERVEDLREALEQGRRRLDAFRTAAGRLALKEVPERALTYLVEASRDLVGVRFGALALMDSQDMSGRFVVSGFPPDQESLMAPCPSQLGDLGLSLEEEVRVVVGDVSHFLKAHGFPPEWQSAESFLGMPVMARGRSSGAIYLMDKEGKPEFSADDEWLLNLFAVLAGVHLENVLLYDEVALERRTLAAIQSSMTEGLVVLGPDSRVMYLNETTGRLWGLDAEDLPGRLISQVFDSGASVFESPEGYRELMGLTTGRKNLPETVTVTLVRPQKRHLEVAAFPIPAGPDHNMTGLITRDITQETEQQERQNAFVSIASHELRTPMTTIMGFAELLLKRDTPEKARLEWRKNLPEQPDPLGHSR